MRPFTPARLLIMIAALAFIATMRPCHATTLWDVWQLAEAHAPELEQAEATLEQAHATHSAALAQLLPALNLNAIQRFASTNAVAYVRNVWNDRATRGLVPTYPHQDVTP